MSTHLGSTSDGRALAYDASLYEFWLDGERAAFADVQMLDTRNWIRWRAPALRDWFRHIIPADLDACNKRARAAARAAAGAGAGSANPASARAVKAESAAASAFAGQASAGDAVRVAAGQATAGAKRAAVSWANVPQGSAYQSGASRQEDNSYLLYRTTDDTVASVNDQGIVKVHGTGTADIYARRVRDGVSGPEMRVATIVLDGAGNIADADGPVRRIEPKTHVKLKKNAESQARAELDNEVGGPGEDFARSDAEKPTRFESPVDSGALERQKAPKEPIEAEQPVKPEEPATPEGLLEIVSDDSKQAQKHKHKKGKHKVKTVAEEVQPEAPQPEAPQAEVPLRSWLHDDFPELHESDFTKGVGGFATWNVR